MEEMRRRLKKHRWKLFSVDLLKLIPVLVVVLVFQMGIFFAPETHEYSLFAWLIPLIFIAFGLLAAYFNSFVRSHELYRLEGNEISLNEKELSAIISDKLRYKRLDNDGRILRFRDGNSAGIFKSQRRYVEAGRDHSDWIIMSNAAMYREIKNNAKAVRAKGA